MTADDKKELQAELEPIKADIKALQDALENLSKGAKEEIGNNRRARFHESGNWGRHYSTVRMGVTTFLISLSLGILTFGWQYWAERPRPVFAFVSAGLWIMALFLFGAFSIKTYTASKSENKHRKNLTTGYDTGLKQPKAFDGACWAMLLVTIGFVILLGYLFCPTRHSSDTVKSKQPIVAPATPTETPEAWRPGPQP